MRHVKFALPILIALLAVVLTACNTDPRTPVRTPAPGIEVDPSGQFVSHEVIVGYAAGSDPTAIAARVGGTLKMDWPLIDAALIELHSDFSVAKAIGLLAGSPGVRYAEPNRVSRNEPVRLNEALYTPGLGSAAQASANILDPQFERQWQHRQIRSEAAWDLGATGKDIRIGIHDEFMDHRHPDLVDNVLYPGMNAFYGSAIHPNTPHDGRGEHGTWVAGSAAASGNDLGGRGVAFEADIVPISISDPTTGLLSEAAIINGGIFAIVGPDGVLGGSDAAPGIDGYVHIVNMSWGSNGYSQSTKDLMDLMLASGITLVTSAGNTPTKGIAAPAWFPGLISVAATTPQDKRTNFSNRGLHLSVAAPGENVWVTATRNCVLATPDGSSCDPSDPEVNYQYVNGTSFSSPITAGVAALILDASADRDVAGNLVGTTLTPAQVRQILEDTARQPAGYAFDDLGFGIVDAAAAVAMAQDSTATPPLGATVEVQVSLDSDPSIGLSEVGVSLVPLDGPGTTLYTQTTGTGEIGEVGSAFFREINPGRYRLSVSGPHTATTGTEAVTYTTDIDVLAGSSTVIPVGLAVAVFDDLFEPNDDVADATAVMLGRTYRAALFSQGNPEDIDMYALDLVNGDDVRVNLETVAGVADTGLRVLAPDGTTVIASNDDNQDQSTDALVTFTANATGTFYVEVTEVNGANNPTNTYEMDIALDAGNEVEPNGSATVSDATFSALDFSDAQTMAVGTALAATIDPLGDVDIFDVTLTAGDVVVVDTEVVTGGSPDTLIALYDNAGTLLASNDDAGGKQESRLRFEVVSTGVHHVVVASWDNSGTGPYGVSTTLHANP